MQLSSTWNTNTAARDELTFRHGKQANFAEESSVDKTALEPILGQEENCLTLYRPQETAKRSRNHVLK